MFARVATLLQGTFPQEYICTYPRKEGRPIPLLCRNGLPVLASLLLPQPPRAQSALPYQPETATRSPTFFLSSPLFSATRPYSTAPSLIVGAQPHHHSHLDPSLSTIPGTFSRPAPLSLIDPTVMSLSTVQAHGPILSSRSTLCRPVRAQGTCGTMKGSEGATNGARAAGKHHHLTNRSTISSNPHSTPARHVSTFAGRRSAPSSPGTRSNPVSELSETTVTSPVSGEAPLSSYTGPTPRSLEGVRAAFFETKGMSLESIKE